MDENIFKGNVKRITHEDMGCTEDEFNNFLIDCMKLLTDGCEPELKPMSIQIEPPVTITLTPKCHPNYLNLNEQSN